MVCACSCSGLETGWLERAGDQHISPTLPVCFEKVSGELRLLHLLNFALRTAHFQLAEEGLDPIFQFPVPAVNPEGE